MMARPFLPTVCGALLATAFGAFSQDSVPSNPAGFKLPDRALYQKGRFIYEQNCIVCHGERGNGKGEMAEQLSPKPRNFRSGLFKYRSTPWGKLPTDDDLIRTIREGRSGTAMGMFVNLRDDELQAVVEYIKSFSRKWQKPENYAEPIPESELPSWFSDASERERRSQDGKKTFLAMCAACHGADANGQGPAAAELKDDAGDPILPADLRQNRLRSGSEPRDIFRVLSTGLNGTPMMSFADALTDEQRWELTAYVVQIRETTKHR